MLRAIVIFISFPFVGTYDCHCLRGYPLRSHWISMLGPTKRVLEEYKSSVMKMTVYSLEEVATKKNLSMLLDWQNVFTLPCLMPMLHHVKSLIKFEENPTCCIVDFIYVAKICQGDLYCLYIDPTFAFHRVEFNTFRSLANDTSMVIEQEWMFCYNREEDHLVFKNAGVSHMDAMRLVALKGNGRRCTRLIMRWSLARCNNN